MPGSTSTTGHLFGLSRQLFMCSVYKTNVRTISVCEYSKLRIKKDKSRRAKVTTRVQKRMKKTRPSFPDCVLPKESRDQGVQVSGDVSDFDEPENNTVDIKTWYQEIYSSNRSSARGNFELPKINVQANINTIATKEDNKSMALRQRAASCCDVNQKAINIKKSILAKSYYCRMSSQEFAITMANSVAEAVEHNPHEVDDVACTSQGRVRMLPMRRGEKSSNDFTTVKDIRTKQIGISRKVDIRSDLNLEMTNQKIFIFGGIDPYALRHPNDSHGADVLYYDGCENAWKYLSNMPGSRHHHSAIVYRERIYVIGGTRPPLAGSIKSVFETAVWSFDPKRLEWNNECTLPQARRDFGLIAYDNDATSYNGIDDDEQGDGSRRPLTGLYIIGGESMDGTPLSSTLHYNVYRKRWSEKASLNIGRYGLVAAVVNTKDNAEIWIAGGVCGQEKDGIPMITDTVEYYNLTNDDGSWKQSVKRLRVPRLFARFCTTRGGKDLYITGGIGFDIQHPGEVMSLSSVDRYDFQEQRWIHYTDMIMSRHGHDVVTLKDKILIFGGVCVAVKRALKSVECLSTKTGNWMNNVAFLPSALSGMAAVVMDCGI